MNTSSFPGWNAGDAIVLRGVWRQKLWWACSATIVHDTPELIAIYWQAGTPNRVPAKWVRPQDLLSDGLRLLTHQWTDTDVLMLITPGSSHAVSLMWETGQSKLRCWYVDLQEPLRRTSLGFDTMDHMLDIVISSDKSSWHWKDEDEFEEALAVGVFSAEEAQSIRAEGESVIQRFQSGQSPFYDGWEHWSPSADWGIPALPAGWDHFLTE